MPIRLSLLVLVLLAACGGPKLVVESTTSWSGNIGGDNSSNSVDGEGNWTFSLHDGQTCWTFQKDTEAGSLRAYVKEPGLFGSSRKGDATTTAAFGIVSGCN